MVAHQDSPPAQAPRGGLIFISYSHENYPDALHCHRALEAMCGTRPGPWSVFLDSEGARKLKAGEHWVGRLNDELGTAGVMIVLISHAYTASRFCTDQELRRMFERRAEGEAVTIIGVALHEIDPAAIHVPDRPDWSLQELQCLPQAEVTTPLGPKLGLKPLSDWDERRIEDGWATVAAQIKEALPDEPHKAQSLPTVPPEKPPHCRWKALATAAFAITLVLASAGLWLRKVDTAVADMHADLRIDRADLVLERLATVPTWLVGAGSRLGRLRTVAKLNMDSLAPDADPTTLADKVRKQIAAHPEDADLLYLQAREEFRQADEAGLAQAVEDATAALRLDPAHAAAHNLLGLVADAQGDLANAGTHYEQASKLRPSEPTYRAHLARNQLDSGKPEDAEGTYQGFSDHYVLAPFEQALAFWAQGKLTEAEQAQSQALALLDNRDAMAQAVNRRAWLFVLLNPRDPTEMLRVTVEPAHRRCLVATERQLTLALRDYRDPATWHLPADCDGLVQISTLLDVIDADLCRYLIHRQPALRDAASALRRQLQQPSPPSECAPLLAKSTNHPAT